MSQVSQPQSGRMNSSDRPQSYVPRKYLGDPEDPHFIPSSPILSRQQLTFEQEEELTRSCERVLSGVITSDEQDSDPVIHIATQIVTKQTKYCENDRFFQSQRSVNTASDPSQKLHRYSSRHAYEITATPSLTSKRTTIDRADIPTPTTMLSEGVRRPSSTRQNSKPYRPSVTHATLDEYPETEQRRNLATVKSMACLSSAHYQSEQLAIALAAAKLNQISISHVEYNKSLPSLPHLESPPCPEKHGAGFTRMLKLAKNKKSAPMAAQACYSIPPKVVNIQASPPTSQSKKNKFHFPNVFDRKKRHQPHQVAVA